MQLFNTTLLDDAAHVDDNSQQSIMAANLVDSGSAFTDTFSAHAQSIKRRRGLAHLLSSYPAQPLKKNWNLPSRFGMVNPIISV